MSSQSTDMNGPRGVPQLRAQHARDEVDDTVPPQPDSGPSTAPTTNTASQPSICHGDIVTIELEMTPENDYVPEGLFDTSGRITFVVGGGNYLPALHELVVGMSTNSEVSNVSVDAGFGAYQSDLVIEVPFSNLFKTILNHDVKKRRQIRPRQILHLKGGFQVTVVKVVDNSDGGGEEESKIVVVDANHPLAGSSYSCSLKVVNIAPNPTASTPETATPPMTSSPFKIATVAMGCFWGGELAFMRMTGVVGTRVGYTQGHVENPTYEQVCDGMTGHREAIQVTYDTRVCSYEDILDVYFERLAATLVATTSSTSGAAASEEGLAASVANMPSSKSMQYQHGIYYHDGEQCQEAEKYLASHEYSWYRDRYNIELKQAAPFYSAEERHQQYLYKGGQSARKGSREIIRCYG